MKKGKIEEEKRTSARLRCALGGAGSGYVSHICMHACTTPTPSHHAVQLFPVCIECIAEYVPGYQKARARRYCLVTIMANARSRSPE